MGATEKIRTSVHAAAAEFTACMTAAGGGITSGGGFGNLTNGGVPTPSWQLTEVQNYIKAHRQLDSWPLNQTLNPYANCSITCGQLGAAYALDGCVYGRGFPDIALLGGGVPIILNGRPQLETGTSVSAPAFRSRRSDQRKDSVHPWIA